MVAMPSLHFFRWTEQLHDSGHEVYWFDIADGGEKVSRIHWVKQIANWKLKYDYPGRYFMKKNFRQLYDFFQRFNEYEGATVFEQKLLEIQPDVVHSFALYVSCTPIFEVMNKYKNIKWIYSSWGSDLFYYQNKSNYLKDIQKVLPRIDYLFTDCNRDYEIAKRHGFVGYFLGVFPGGGGFDLNRLKAFSLPQDKRKTILIKGFQGRSGRAIPVLKALETLEKELQDFEIVIFGADKDVVDYCNKTKLAQWENFTVYGKLSHQEVLQWMGKALIYVGNSNSDGIPNTLLEAICMDVFPIQSNPGGVTEEIIINGKNGLLIEDCEDEEEIINKIKTVLKTPALIQNAVTYNAIIKEGLDYNRIKSNIVEKYNAIESNGD
jgi:glycosyltransferase involved in cell wall biosynthesis